MPSGGPGRFQVGNQILHSNRLCTMVKPRIGHVAPSRWMRVLILAACLIAIVMLVIRLVRPPSSQTAITSSIQSRQVAWTCEQDPDHQFTSHFRFEPLTCKYCGATCAIQLTYICPNHKGPFEALVRFARASDDSHHDSGSTAMISQYRYTNSDRWHDSNGSVICPEPDCHLVTRRAKTPWGKTKSMNSTSD